MKNPFRCNHFLDLEITQCRLGAVTSGNLRIPCRKLRIRHGYLHSNGQWVFGSFDDIYEFDPERVHEIHRMGWEVPALRGVLASQVAAQIANLPKPKQKPTGKQIRELDDIIRNT